MASTPAGSLRYEQPPILQSVCAYGSETLVPNNDICRLSYYLKCCAVGCGINIGIDDALLDYMNAHYLSAEQQEQILRFSFTNLNLVNLMNRAFILDDQHVLLPQGTLNTFFEFKTAVAFFSIDSFTIATGQHVNVHKVMLCTLKWMKEYYLEPFVRYQQGNPVIEIHASPVAEEDEVSYAVGGDDYRHQGMVVTPVLDHHGAAQGVNSLVHLRRTCCACIGAIQMNDAPCYRCTQCPMAEFCEDCYTAGWHDQTHIFERICRTSTEALAARVETLHEGDALFPPDVPMAIAIPVEQSSDWSRKRSIEKHDPVARAVKVGPKDDKENNSTGRSARTSCKKRRRTSASVSSLGGVEQQQEERISLGTTNCNETLNRRRRTKHHGGKIERGVT
jgi:hypothetical protein